MGTHLRVLNEGLSNEYQHDRVKTVFIHLCVLMYVSLLIIYKTCERYIYNLKIYNKNT